MHQRNAGKQESDSEIATPSKISKKVVELIANTAKRTANAPILRSNGSCFAPSPITNKEIASNIKKDADMIKCVGKMVSGNSPIPISAKALKLRMCAPILFDIILANPRENTSKSTPPITMPQLNSNADALSTPKSLKAF